MKKIYSPFFLILFLGLIIRLIFVPHPGFEADIAYWKWWGEAASKGPANALYTTSINYPPFFIYVLGLIWKIYAFLSPSVSPEQLYQTNNFLFLLIVKLPAIISDLVIAVFLYWLAKKSADKIFFSPLLPTSLYLFNPVVIYDSAVWGQTDAIAAALSLLSLILLLKQKIWLTFIIAVIALETKVQTVIFFPLLILLTLRFFGLKKTVEGFSAGAATFVIINLPYILSGLMIRAMGLIFESASYFPLASLNAYNLWWLIAKGNGFTVSDATLVFNSFSYKSLGLLFFSFIYLLLCLVLWQQTKLKSILNSLSETNILLKKPNLLFSISLIFSAVSFAFFMLPTQIHERYIFPLFVFLPLVGFFGLLKTPPSVIIIQKKVTKIKLFAFLIYFSLITLSVFINLHLVLTFNYPNNGFPLFSLLNHPSVYLPITLFISVLNLFLFFGLLLIILKKLSSKTFFLMLGLFSLIIITQLAISYNYRQQKEVSLAKLKPSFIKQEWGSLKINKTVENRLLSSSYVWYKEGLGTHTNSQIDYDLNKKYSLFITDFGIDTESSDNASVIFSVLGDGKTLYRSQIIKKWNWPIHIEIPIKGIQKLSLIVTDAEDGNNGDHADWLNPRLYK